MIATFFDEIREQSEVKSLLVSKYFWVWAKIIVNTQKRYPQHAQRIAYIDLFAGPGRYKDGQLSTPIRVLQSAIEDEDIRQRLVTIFNDKDAENVSSLKKSFDEVSGIDTLKYTPQILNFEVGEDIAQQFESSKLVPTLFFVDPWGYKGLSLRLVNSVVKDFGCDCIFFFNYNRINMGLNNDAVKEHMEALFGVERAKQIRAKLSGLNPNEREFVIVNALSEALQEMSGRYVLPFTFRNSYGTRTSHHLIFVTKNFRGYEIMKGIMAQHSSSIEQGVASFDFNPVNDPQLTFLYELSRPLDELGDKLLKQFAGQTLTTKQIYEAHNVGTPYILSNYKEALKALEEQGKIRCTPPAEKRQPYKGRPSFADSVSVTFLQGVT